MAPDEDEDESKWGEKGGAFLSLRITPSSRNTSCGIGCNGRSTFLPKAEIIFVRLSRFTNGVIQNKTSIPAPLVTHRGTGARNQIKAV